MKSRAVSVQLVTSGNVDLVHGRAPVRFGFGADDIPGEQVLSVPDWMTPDTGNGSGNRSHRCGGRADPIDRESASHRTSQALS